MMGRGWWQTLPFSQRMTFLGGSVIIALLTLAAVGAPWIAPYPLDYVNPDEALGTPSAAHLLGTDEDGYDLLTRLIFGARIALVVGVGTVAVSVVLGFLVGCVSGYLGGWVDEVLMRFLEILMSFPGILLAILIIFLSQEPSEWTVILALSVTGWAGYARLIRGQVLTVKQEEFVVAAEALGCSTPRIIWQHLIPNVMGPVVVQATFGIAGAILAEASLSFLGLGPQGTPSWGAILDQGAILFIKSPHIGFAAGIAIFLTITGFHMVGDVLRDAADPRSRKA